ncbi:hypothetical protein ES703_100939 [subsurface metagenome]
MTMKRVKETNSMRSTSHWDANSAPPISHWGTAWSTTHWDTNSAPSTSHWNTNSAPLTIHWEPVPFSQNQTVGGQFKLTYISQEVRRIIEPIFMPLSKTKNPDIVKEVRELVSIITESILELNQSYFDISNLPSLIAANLEDGSFLIEWIFLNYRVGFVVEADPKESIWYLVSKSESSDSNLSGSLADRNKKTVLSQLVSHVALNS